MSTKEYEVYSIQYGTYAALSGHQPWLHEVAYAAWRRIDFPALHCARKEELALLQFSVNVHLKSFIYICGVRKGMHAHITTAPAWVCAYINIYIYIYIHTHTYSCFVRTYM